MIKIECSRCDRFFEEVTKYQADMYFKKHKWNYVKKAYVCSKCITEEERLVRTNKFSKNRFRRELNQDTILRKQYPNCKARNFGEWLYNTDKIIFDKEYLKWAKEQEYENSSYR